VLVMSKNSMMRLLMLCLPAMFVAAATIGSAQAANAITGDEMCKAMHWPMPLPPTVGYEIDRTIERLGPHVF
jgi:hypothetical protein